MSRDTHLLTEDVSEETQKYVDPMHRFKVNNWWHDKDEKDDNIDAVAADDDDDEIVTAP